MFTEDSSTGDPPKPFSGGSCQDGIAPTDDNASKASSGGCNVNGAAPGLAWLTLAGAALLLARRRKR